MSATAKRFRFGQAVWIVAGVVAILLVIPALASTNIVRLVLLTLIWITTSIAWNLVGGFAGQVSFGFAVFYGLGAYTAVLLINAGANPYLSFLGSAAVSAIASLIIGLPTFRLRGPYFAIATIGVSEAVRVVMNNLSFVGGAGGLRLNEHGPFRQAERYYVALAVALIAVVISIAIDKSRFGLALRAIRQDEDAAADLGVNPYTSKLLIHAIAGALTGVAGGIYAWYAAYVHPQGVFAFSTSISILLMPVIGGIGTTLGAVLGAVVVLIVEEELVVFFPEIHLLIYGLLLTIIILFERDGLVGLFQRLFRRKRVNSSGPGANEVLWRSGRLEGS